MPTPTFLDSTQPPGDTSGWGPWTMDLAEPAEGPGLLVSPMFWLGGAASLMLWGCATALALRFI